MKKIFSKALCIWFVAFLLIVPFVHAAPEDIDLIVEPINNIYNLVKAVVSVVALLAITFAGVKFMFSGDNIQAREGAKSMLGYAVVGLVVVWMAPVIVSYLTSPVV